MERFKILTEKPQDIEAVYELHRKAFTRNDESNLVNRLRSSEEYLPELSLVAKTEKEKLVGHIMFSKIVIKGKENFSSLSLAPMAVHPDYQKQNIGTALVKRGLEKATELNFTSVIVLGHPKYYSRFGFKPASHWGIKAPFEAPDNAFLAIELLEGSLEAKSGIVQYSPAFREI